MKRIYYTSGSLLTGDRTASAVVNYAQALAIHESSAAVEIPVRLDDGTTSRAQLLIGPASQLVVVPEPSAADVPEDDELIEELVRQTHHLASPHPQPEEQDPSTFGQDSDYDDIIAAMAADRLA